MEKVKTIINVSWTIEYLKNLSIFHFFKLFFINFNLISNLTFQSFFQILRTVVSNNLAGCVDVRQVGGDSGCVHNIVERQVGDQWTVLQQQWQRLADATWSAAHGDLDIVLEKSKRRRNEIQI